MDNPNVATAVPAGGNVAKPASGTYGDGAELDRLESALPSLQPQQSSPTVAAPSPMTPRPPQAPMSGLPEGLFAPTTQPNVPVSTPPTQQAPVAGTPPEQRIQLLDAYANNPAFSETTRQFFASYRDKLIRG